jgi:3-hydroxyisobutyrate dehydrogenase-like beta-hydroxyacid dehydrogenase
MTILGVDVIDAPVTNERRGDADVLRVYAGGNAAALERVSPVLRAMVDEVVHFGACGNGLAMKHVVNLLAQANRILIVEALALGRQAGLDQRQMIDTILGSKGNSVAFERLAPRIAARDFDGVPLRVTCEDLALQNEMADSLHVPTFMASTALQVYKMAVAMGLGEHDSAALLQVYERYQEKPC